MSISKISKPSFLVSTTVILLFCPKVFAQKGGPAPRIVTWNCSGCHGTDGNSQAPYFPRLAGLNASYAEQRIAEFRAAGSPPVDELFSRLFRPVANNKGASNVDARINMIGIAHGITAEETKTSAAWYAMQKPEPGRGGDSVLIQEGKALYLKGLSSQGLSACQACHGAEGEGKAKIPRLAGQNGRYLLSELAKFKAGDRQHAPEMTIVTQHVEAEQFRALATYLQSK